MSTSPNKYEESKARYMTDDKKRYYLASVDENVQMLVNSQKDELTRLLIDLKTEYDTITRETRRKKEEEENLKHKIDILDQMASKTKKNMEIAVTTNETMKNAIEVKKKRKEEETYLRKTLMTQIDKLKLDNLLIKKEILQKENESKRLSKNVQRGKLNQNDIKERYNGVYSRITSQNQRNKFNNNEQSLQLQYYTTIIEHKSMFIQSADERKERQIRITQEAKNNSADQMEEMKRKQFEMLVLYNKYLQFKMEKQLSQNTKIEETYQEIKDICGTSNLSEIADIILSKDKHYNFNVGLISEQEKTRDMLKGDNDELNKELIKLKTELPVHEGNEEEKTISPIEIGLIEEDEKKLMQMENGLREGLYQIEEKHRNIDLIFNKVVENVYLLCKEKSYLTSFQNEAEEAKEERYITTGVEETNMNENKTTNMNEATDIAKHNKTQADDNDTTEHKPEQNNAQDENKDNNVSQAQVNEEEKKETLEKENEEEKEGEKEGEGEDTNEISLPLEYEEVITSLNNFLKGTLKRFQGLFLCHSKQEFLRIMQEKGIESNMQSQLGQTQQQQQLTQTIPARKLQARRKTYARPPSYKPPSLETTVQAKDPMSSIYKGELQYERDEPVQIDERVVFKQFVDEIRRNREDYIKHGPIKE